MLDITALFSLSYGIYLLGAHSGDQLGGCLVNTVFQLTAEPVRVGVSVAKENQTHAFMCSSGTVSVNVMAEEAEIKLLGAFGYRSGRDFNKLEGVAHHLDLNGDPLLESNVLAQLSCKITDKVDMGTHTLFICDVQAAHKNGDGTPMTYNYFRDVKKGKAGKYAPTYVAPSSATAPAGKQA